MWHLRCPQCGATMSTVEKGGAPVERCFACQGVFLDRSQLDRFLAAEAAYYASARRRDPGRTGGFLAELFD